MFAKYKWLRFVIHVRPAGEIVARALEGSPKSAPTEKTERTGRPPSSRPGSRLHGSIITNFHQTASFNHSRRPVLISPVAPNTKRIIRHDPTDNFVKLAPKCSRRLGCFRKVEAADCIEWSRSKTGTKTFLRPEARNQGAGCVWSQPSAASVRLKKRTPAASRASRASP
jgi:hypothetical protein